jgi:hypothetical protein
MYSMQALPSRALVGLSVFLVLLGCGDSARSVSAPLPPPVVPTPAPTPPPVVPAGEHLPFPALTGPGQVYLSLLYFGGGLQERYVFYDDGTFVYQHANESSVAEWAGTYTRSAGAIAINWMPGLTGPYADRYTMIGTIVGDELTVPHTGPMSPEFEEDDWGNFPSTYYRGPS